MAKYRHIVFDVDGTLIDTRDCILYSLQEMLMTVKGERYEIEDLKFVLANTSVKNMHLLGVEEEKIPGAVEMWVANEEKNIDMIRIFDGIEELLEKLEKKGSSLRVVTSRTREELELVLDQLPIRKYFSICICADDTKEHKPSAQPLLKYMELSGARKEETVYIGDSASDMACALNAGVDCVHAVWGEPETEADATYRAGKPEQLEEIFL